MGDGIRKTVFCSAILSAVFRFVNAKSEYAVEGSLYRKRSRGDIRNSVPRVCQELSGETPRRADGVIWLKGSFDCASSFPSDGRSSAQDDNLVGRTYRLNFNGS